MSQRGHFKKNLKIFLTKWKYNFRICDTEKNKCWEESSLHWMHAFKKNKYLKTNI